MTERIVHFVEHALSQRPLPPWLHMVRGVYHVARGVFSNSSRRIGHAGFSLEAFELAAGGNYLRSLRQILSICTSSQLVSSLAQRIGHRIANSVSRPVALAHLGAGPGAAPATSQLVVSAGSASAQSAQTAGGGRGD